MLACGAMLALAPALARAQRATRAPELTPAQVERARSGIMAMMQESAKAWTRGDLDAFMRFYAPDTTTTFVTPKGVLHGIAAIRGVYASRFAPGGPPHDSLSFENIEIDVLAPNAANVIAFYRLSRGDSTTARGPTTVVLRHDAAAGWRIIHDHSS
ncbi:MAG TPA: SgcJ/EcaC family oxidoreductase [Candidatus Elarobacter sp.]|nr:SgcJ/EcaC family oxidoreductase [Candidatus Elarobacter sp.]